MKRAAWILLAIVWPAFAPAEDLFGDRIAEFKKSVVNVELRGEVSLAKDETGIFYATGFVADADKGLVVTNQHVVGVSPASRIDLTFWNGATVPARTVYYDPWHDFAFLRFDPSRLHFKPAAVTFGRHADLTENEELLLIGNNERESYTIKRGRLTKLFVSKTPNSRWGRSSHHLHTDFDRTGGSSGSPVWNRAGRVVGLHTSGSDTSSFELRIDYVTAALEAIRRGKTPLRGDLGLVLATLPISKAQDYYGYPSDRIERLRKSHPTLQSVLKVVHRLEGSKTSKLVRTGDLILSIEGRPIGEDLYEFDRISDGRVGKTVRLELLRDRKPLTVELEVADAQLSKPTRFATFAGGTFHDLTPNLGLLYHIPAGGVLLSEVRPGTSFVTLGAPSANERRNYKRAAVVRRIDGEEIRSLADFIRIAANTASGRKSVIVARDVWEDGETEKSEEVQIESSLYPLRVLEWNPTREEWEVRNP